MANNKTGKDASGSTFTYKTTDTAGVDTPHINVDVVATTATALGKAEDAVHASGDTGVMMLAVRNDAGTALAADGDYIPVMVDSAGRLYVNVAAGTLALSGEDHIGQVGGATVVIKPTLTISTSAYTGGDTVAGEITLTSAMRISGGSGVLTDLVITDADAEGPGLQLLIFDSDPASTSAANDAFAWGSGDLARLIGVVEIASTDFDTIGGEKIAYKTGLNIGVKASGSANLYAHLLITEAKTYTATSDLTLAVKFLQD